MVEPVIQKMLIMYCLIAIFINVILFYVDDLATYHGAKFNSSALNVFRYWGNLTNTGIVSNVGETEAWIQNNIFITAFTMFFSGLVYAFFSFIMVGPLTGLLIGDMFSLFNVPYVFQGIFYAIITITVIFGVKALMQKQE